MKNELIAYAKPNISKTDKSPFNMLHIFLVSLFSSLTALLGNITFGIVVVAVYLGLSLLCFIDKNVITRYLKLVLLCVIDVSVACIYIFNKCYPDAQIVTQSFLWGLIFFTVYEVVVFVKIKKRAYSSKINNKKSNSSVIVITVFVFTLVFKLLNNNPDTQYLIFMILTLLCSATILIDLMMLQKNIIYIICNCKE